MKHLLFSNRLYAIFFLISFSLLFPYGTCAQTLSTQDKIVSDTIKIPKGVGGIQKGSYFVIQKSANKPSNINKIFIYVPFGGDRHKEIPLTKGIKLRETIYKNGDGISQQLAEILSETMANAMGLTNRQARTRC